MIIILTMMKHRHVLAIRGGEINCTKLKGLELTGHNNVVRTGGSDGDYDRYLTQLKLII